MLLGISRKGTQKLPGQLAALGEFPSSLSPSPLLLCFLQLIHLSSYIVGIKTTTDSDVKVTHLVVPKVDKITPRVVYALPSQTWIVKPEWIDALLAAGAPGPMVEDNETPSELETNYDLYGPDPEQFLADVLLEKYPGCSLRPDPARSTLFQGLTIWVWDDPQVIIPISFFSLDKRESDSKLTLDPLPISFLQLENYLPSLAAAWTTTGAEVVYHNPISEAFETEEAIKEVVKEMKKSADGRYHRFLLENRAIIPEAAKGSGLIVIIMSRQRHELTRDRLWQFNEDALAS